MRDETETLLGIRDVISAIHDQRTGGPLRNPGLSALEMAALRDCYRRLTEVIGRMNTETVGAKEER